jgi:signal transduction histidine kinase
VAVNGIWRRLFAPPWPLSYALVALVLAASTPLIGLAAWMAWIQNERQREVVEQGLLRTAEALSLEVDREVGIIRAKLETLAQSDRVDRRDWAGFYLEAKRATEDRPGAWIVLFDPSGQQIVNTSRPLDAALPNTFEEARAPTAPDDALPTGSVRTIKEVMRTGKAGNSDLFVGIVSRRPTVTVDVPVVRDGQVFAALNMGLPPGAFTALLRQVRSFEGGAAAVIDRSGFLIGRYENADDHVGRKASRTTLAELARGERAGVGRGLTEEQVPVYHAYVRSGLTGWTVTAGAPLAEVDAEVLRGRRLWTSLALLAVLASVALAIWLARRIAAPIAALAVSAAQDTPTAPTLPRSFSAREVKALEAALARAARARDSQSRERELRVAAAARQAEAEAANRAKDRFLAILGHELRNPLGALANALAVIERLPHDRSAHEIARRQVRLVSKIADDLLDVARIASGKVRLHAEPLDLKAVAGACVASVQQASRVDAAPIRFEGESVHVVADQVRLT